MEANSAAEQHAALRRRLEDAGCEVLRLGASPGLTLDAVYAHDASIVTDEGAILFRTGKPSRRSEAGAHEAFYRSEGIPILAALEAPATAEGGDLVWLDPRTLLVGRGYRTNRAALSRMREILRPAGVTVIAAPLPHGAGPSACVHLMSHLSMLDDSTVLVDRERLAVETVELLQERGFALADILPPERHTLACNVLSLGGGRLLALEANAGTNCRLADRGFDVRTFPGSQIALNGGGGPTCLTRPLLRA